MKGRECQYNKDVFNNRICVGLKGVFALLYNKQSLFFYLCRKKGFLSVFSFIDDTISFSHLNNGDS